VNTELLNKILLTLVSALVYIMVLISMYTHELKSSLRSANEHIELIKLALKNIMKNLIENDKKIKELNGQLSTLMLKHDIYRDREKSP
jgi:septal ring factor EnvC (AmiA/AmiB activator)